MAIVKVVVAESRKTVQVKGLFFETVNVGGVPLGETSTTAYRGDRGKIAYDHAGQSGNPHNTTKAQVGLSEADNTSDANKPISTATQAALAAKADLVGGKVPSAQLPASVDEILEYANVAAFPATGANNILYLALDTDLLYRWSGSTYVNINSGNGNLALGETSTTAYRGDRGAQAYNHISANNNPHSTTKSQVGLSEVDNTSDANKPVSTLQAQAISAKANSVHTHAISDITGLSASLTGKLNTTGGTLTGALAVPQVAYGAGWASSAEVPTKGSIYAKIESLAQ